MPARSTASTTIRRRATTRRPPSSRGSGRWRSSRSISRRREVGPHPPVMAGHSPLQTGVNALMPGHPRFALWRFNKEDVDARHKAGHDEGENMHRVSLAIVSLVVLACGALPAAAQYPSRTVKLIVPQTPGGATDVFARKIGQLLSDRWGQPVVIENRAGAGGVVDLAREH